MTDQVHSGKLDVTSLQNIIDVLSPKAPYGIVESLVEIDFPPPNQERIDVTMWPKGRIFCEAFELRWEQVDGGYRVIFAAKNEVKPPEELTKIDYLQLNPPGNQKYYCWNERDPRLSRTLDYRCVPGRGNVKLTVLEYRDYHGRLVFWRYAEMKREV